MMWGDASTFDFATEKMEDMHASGRSIVSASFSCGCAPSNTLLSVASQALPTRLGSQLIVWYTEPEDSIVPVSGGAKGKGVDVLKRDKEAFSMRYRRRSSPITRAVSSVIRYPRRFYAPVDEPVVEEDEIEEEDESDDDAISYDDQIEDYRESMSKDFEESSRSNLPSRMYGSTPSLLTRTVSPIFKRRKREAVEVEDVNETVKAMRDMQKEKFASSKPSFLDRCSPRNLLCRRAAKRSAADPVADSQLDELRLEKGKAFKKGKRRMSTISRAFAPALLAMTGRSPRPASRKLDESERIKRLGNVAYFKGGYLQKKKPSFQEAGW